VTTTRAAIALGVLVGVVYTLSPLTVWFAAAMALVVWAARRGLDADEQRWIAVVLVTAIAVRVLAVAALFVATDRDAVPFGSFFGDEEYFIKRSIWLRNVALGVPMHGADLIYGFEDYSATSYLYVLAFVQVLVGPAPYGAHLLGIAFYMAGTVVLYRVARPAYGRGPALVGLAVLLFLPSQFAWSISALKEPLFFLLTASTVTGAVGVVRARTPWRRVVAAASVIGAAAALETIRPYGAALSLCSVVAGLTAAFVVVRPRLLLATIVALPIAIGAALSRPQVQYRVNAAIQSAAQQHWGHINTPGVVYKLLDDQFYADRREIERWGPRDVLRFLVRAVADYVTVPLPWQVQSQAALAYLPEQVIWYAMVALAPFGIVFAMRRDSTVTCLLLVHAAIAALTVALISGNVGTLVRHRGLAVPYLLWLSAVGACELFVRAGGLVERSNMKVDPAWP